MAASNSGTQIQFASTSKLVIISGDYHSPEQCSQKQYQELRFKLCFADLIHDTQIRKI